jgi:hypothetical protein
MSKTPPFLFKNYTWIFFTSAFLCMLTCSLEGMAQGNLLITPKRVVFNQKQRSQEINLANIGIDTARYVVSFIQIRMNDNGFEQITKPDPGQNFADEFLRIFPRSVTLAPNEAQLVKIQVRPSEKLLPGEYRSHLYFRAVPKETVLGERPSATDTSSFSVRLTPVFGISIPIIIRVGESTAEVTLSNSKLEIADGNIPVLTTRFNRTGNMSVYGDLTVEHISMEGIITRAGLIKGISVYTPNSYRNIRVQLDKTSGINYQSGKLRITYTSPIEENAVKLASTELTLK